MNKTPFHVTLRRKTREVLNSVLAFLINKKVSNAPIDPKLIQKVAIIRPNYRIGNLLFLTPFINELYKINPNIKVDVYVGSKGAGAILQEMPNVHEVIDISRELLKNPLDLLTFIKQHRQKSYDLLFNIVSGSVSSQIVASLVQANYKVAYEDKKSWMALTHEVQAEGWFVHSALNHLELLKPLGYQKPHNPPVMDIKLTQKEKEFGEKELIKVLQSNKKTKAVALFRNARFEKRLSDTWWSEFVDTLLQKYHDIAIIDILSPDVPTPLNEKVLSYSNKNLRKLGAFFHACDAYISSDTGPMHLAQASGAKVFALFNKTNPASFGVLDGCGKNIIIDHLTPQEVAKEIEI